MDELGVLFVNRASKSNDLRFAWSIDHLTCVHLGVDGPVKLRCFLQSMLHFINKLVVGLFTRCEAADDPRVGDREYAIIVPLDKHIAQESLQSLVNDSSRTEHTTFIIPQIVSS